MDDLATTQRQLWRLLTAPDGVRRALDAVGDADGASLRGWLCGDERLPAWLRLEVYANAYFYRIRDALAEDTPALAASLGEAGFHDLVTAYLLVHPPTRPSLRHAGEHLPRFLADDPAGLPFRRRWPFAGDLARLEWALVDAFDAPDAPPLAREALSALAPADWEHLALALHPSCRLLAVGFPVQRMRDALEAGEPVAAADASPEPARLVVWRRGERVLYRALDDDEAEALERVRAGDSFGALCVHLAGSLGFADRAPARAAALLARWIEDELLAA